MGAMSELTAAAIASAAITRIQDAPAALGDRTTYIGASAEGRCLRNVVWGMLNPTAAKITDAKSAGRMLAGRALEGEVVSLVRAIVGRDLRNTGHNQAELVDTESPLRAHPDGIFTDGTMLEIKTAGSGAFRKYRSQGLPVAYVTQANTQMGLAGSNHAVVVVVDRDTLEAFTVTLDFNPELFQQSRARAKAAWEDFQAGLLPKGEPDRGPCQYCPLKDSCPEHNAAKATQGDGTEGLDLAASLALEGNLERLREVQTILAEKDADTGLSPLDLIEEEKNVRDQIKDLLVRGGVQETDLPMASLSCKREVRVTFDSKKFKEKSPDEYAKYIKESVSYRLNVDFRD